MKKYILFLLLLVVFANTKTASMDNPLHIQENETLHVKATAYCPCSKCCGKWADGITYTGTKATQGRTIAVDPKVIPLGTKVLIDGQIYIAEDIGGGIKGNRIDVFFDCHNEALKWGVKKLEIEIKSTY